VVSTVIRSQTEIRDPHHMRTLSLDVVLELRPDSTQFSEDKSLLLMNYMINMAL
jgi:hypothetical protein